MVGLLAQCLCWSGNLTFAASPSTCWDERLPVTQFLGAELLLAQRTRHEFFHSCLLGTSAQRKPAGPWQQYQTSGKKTMVSWCFLSILAGLLQQNLPKPGVCQLSKPVDPGISRCPAMRWEDTPGYPQQKIGEIQQQKRGATLGSSKNVGI